MKKVYKCFLCAVVFGGKLAILHPCNYYKVAKISKLHKQSIKLKKLVNKPNKVVIYFWHL